MNDMCSPSWMCNRRLIAVRDDLMWVGKLCKQKKTRQRVDHLYVYLYTYTLSYRYPCAYNGVPNPSC